MWFVPLCLMLGGTGICTVAYCVVAPLPMTIRYIVDALEFYAVGAIAAAAVVYMPPLRALADNVAASSCP